MLVISIINKIKKMNELIENNLDDIEKICNHFYNRYKLKRYYEFEDVMQGALLFIVSTIKHFDINKAPITRWLYIQISNHCKNLIKDMKKDSKAINYDFMNRQLVSVGCYEDINEIDDIMDFDFNLEHIIIGSQITKEYIKIFKDDKLKLKIIYYLINGYKRKEICDILNIKTRVYDYQLKLIKRELKKVI